MKHWSTAHAALLESLRAQSLIPRLYTRLSLERYAASEDELRRLMAWPAVLMQQPGWALIEPALDQVDAWPETWHLASQMGFSPLAAHHHALLFGRLTSRLVEDQEYEQATWTWSECIASWRTVALSTYLPELLDDISQSHDDDDEEQIAARHTMHSEVVAHLLDHLVDVHEQHMHTAIKLLDTERERRTDIDFRLARFSWSALKAAQLIARELDPTQVATHAQGVTMISHMAARIELFSGSLRTQILETFEKDSAQIDVNDDTSAQLLTSFEWIGRCAEIMGHDTGTATKVVVAAVGLGWKLRRTGREEEGDDFDRMLMLCAPFHKFLTRQLEKRTFVGPNSKCSDFMVFQGESSNDHEYRKARFERALKVCPGHRNASLMLSYEHLHLANQSLHAISLIPAPLKHLPVGDRPKMLWRSAHKHLEDARAAYPFNERLEEYQTRLDEAAKRLRITPPTKPGEE